MAKSRVINGVPIGKRPAKAPKEAPGQRERRETAEDGKKTKEKKNGGLVLGSLISQERPWSSTNRFLKRVNCE